MGVFGSMQHDPCLIDPFLTDRQEKPAVDRCEGV
jgi:hypothetical protein